MGAGVPPRSKPRRRARTGPNTGGGALRRRPRTRLRPDNAYLGHRSSEPDCPARRGTHHARTGPTGITCGTPRAHNGCWDLAPANRSLERGGGKAEPTRPAREKEAPDIPTPRGEARCTNTTIGQAVRTTTGQGYSHSDAMITTYAQCGYLPTQLRGSGFKTANKFYACFADGTTQRTLPLALTCTCPIFSKGPEAYSRTGPGWRKRDSRRSGVKCIYYPRPGAPPIGGRGACMGKHLLHSGERTPGHPPTECLGSTPGRRDQVHDSVALITRHP